MILEESDDILSLKAKADAKKRGLTHQSHNIWKDKQGKEYKWNAQSKRFDEIEEKFEIKNFRNQNNIERLQDKIELGKMTPDEANVQMVRDERFRIVSKMPKNVRTALNNAVKKGLLGHMKKEDYKPEVYYHPDFKYLAIEARNTEFKRTIKALKGVIA